MNNNNNNNNEDFADRHEEQDGIDFDEALFQLLSTDFDDSNPTNYTEHLNQNHDDDDLDDVSVPLPDPGPVDSDAHVGENEVDGVSPVPNQVDVLNPLPWTQQPDWDNLLGPEDIDLLLGIIGPSDGSARIGIEEDQNQPHLLLQQSEFNVITETTKAVCFGLSSHPGTQRWQEETDEISSDRATYPQCPRNIGQMIINVLQHDPDCHQGFLIYVDRDNDMPLRNLSDENGEWRLASRKEISRKTRERFKEYRRRRSNSRRTRNPQIVMNLAIAAPIERQQQQQPPAEDLIYVERSVIEMLLSIDYNTLGNDDKAKFASIFYRHGCSCREHHDEALAERCFERSADICNSLPDDWPLPP